MIEPLLQAERLLLYGMIEQAEQIYRRVAEQDPLNSIAVVGLARVALERGDDELALVHARAALEIDPENAAARRLVARLAEVQAEQEKRAAGQRPFASSAPAPTPEAPDAPAAAAAPDARPSEQAVFTRNPSMADHRAMERDEGDTLVPAPDQPEEKARDGLLRRLLRLARR